MNFGADEIYRIWKAKDRDFKSCYKNFVSLRSCEDYCDDTLCEKLVKLMDKLEVRLETYESHWHCPCHLHTKSLIRHIVSRILGDYET